MSMLLLFLSLHESLIVIYSVLYNVKEERIHAHKCNTVANGTTNITMRLRVIRE